VPSAALARLERVRPRTLVSVVAFAVAFYVLLPQLADVQRTADAAAQAQLGWLIPALLASGASYICAAIAMVGSVPQPVPFWATFRMQVASSFASRIAPANTGALAVGVRFLQRAGVQPAVAATSVGLNMVAGFVMHAVLLVAFVAWTGTGGVGGFHLPDATTALLVVAVLLAASGLVIALVPAVRERVLPQVVAQARTALGSATDVVTDPWRLFAMLGGSAGVTLCYIAALTATVLAFDGGLSVPQIGAAYLVAAALGVAVTHPGRAGRGRGRPGHGPDRLRHARRHGRRRRAHVPADHVLAAGAPGLVRLPAHAGPGGALVIARGT
jgi:undecaprenyl-diphosphatase